MVAPVLRAAKDHLLQASDRRQELDAEVGNLRERAGQLVRDVEAKYEELRRAEETAADRVKRHLARKQELEEAAAQLRREIFQVERENLVLKYQATEGLAKEFADWEHERRQLEDEIARLDEEKGIKTERLNVQLPEQQQQQRDKITAEQKRLKKFEPDSKEKAELTRRVVLRENKCMELQQQMQDIDNKKAEARRRRLRAKKAAKAEARGERKSESPTSKDSRKAMFARASTLNRHTEDDDDDDEKDDEDSYQKGANDLGLLTVKDLKKVRDNYMEQPESPKSVKRTTSADKSPRSPRGRAKKVKWTELPWP